VEAPKARLKAIQRKIATEILQTIPCHSAAHGFIRGRSALSYVQPHVGKPVLLRMDLQDFFPSIAASRIFGLFRSMGYPHAMTQLLTNLCTATCSEEKLRIVLPDGCRFQLNLDRWWQIRALYCRKHLPQGAPTSPALANLIAYRLDCRLAGLARSVGINYTRYADDLLFSGSEKFGRVAKALAIEVGSIAQEEGFQVQFRKTRIMRAATRQTAAGIILNRCTNLNRIEYDRLKAILFNCIRLGPSTQNRNQLADFEAHLRGRVNWVRQLHPARGEKLTALFSAIDWSK
jgi:retron-type reverse transcriptase